MDSDNFFGFDATIPVDEEELGEDGDYDALNDETFGSAAVGGDWEENHKQLSSLTESERLQRAIRRDVKDYSSRHSNFDPRNLHLHEQDLHNNEALRRTLQNLSLEKGLDKKRLFERSLGSSPLIELQKDDLSTSPGNNIWSPTIGLETLENLRQLNQKSQYNTFTSHPLSNELNHFQSNRSNSSPLQDLNLHSNVPTSFKTVSELEDELKRQHLNHQRTITVEDLEKEISRQAINSRKTTPGLLSSSFPNPRLPSSQFHNPLLQQTHANFPGNNSAKSSNSFQYNMGGSNAVGNVHNNVQYPAPLLSNIHNKVMPPGFINNVSHLSRSMGSFPHQLNHSQRGLPNRGFLHGGNNQCRNNLNRNNMEKRNYDQNFRFDQMRNSGDHQRENNGHGGNRVRRDSDAEWEEWQRIRQADEYSGLMTPREKSWLRNIQAMQLQTENPYQDDYYFVMHNVKDQRKREEEVIEIDGLQLMLGLADKGKEGKEYEPPKLENSLGKLQVASVNAPRKIIDLQVVHLDSSHPTTLLQRDMRKHRHLLLHIEKLYNIQIQLDDLERKIRALPDCPTRDLFRSKCRQLVSKMWTSLTNPHESFVQLLCIRKGKTLAARLLTWVSQAEVEHLLATVIQNMSLLTKKDVHDKRLALFWPIADRFFSISSPSTLITFCIMMTAQLKAHKNQFIPAVASKLSVSIVFSLLVRGEVLWSELEKDEAWQHFLKAVVLGLSSLFGKATGEVQPLPSVTLAASPRLPSNRLASCDVDVDPEALRRALDVLKGFESHLMKNAFSGHGAPASSATSKTSSFSGVHNPHAASKETQHTSSNVNPSSPKCQTEFNQ